MHLYNSPSSVSNDKRALTEMHQYQMAMIFEYIIFIYYFTDNKDDKIKISSLAYFVEQKHKNHIYDLHFYILNNFMLRWSLFKLNLMNVGT